MDGEFRSEKVPAARPRDRSRAELVNSREQAATGTKERLIQDKRLELFDAQHDNTGSWKGEYFARDMREDIVSRGFETGPDGAMKASPEDVKTHYMLVNMGELDRVNAMGDHSSGDKALEATAMGIRTILGQLLQESQYDVYRTAGNDFSVRLKNVDRETAARLTRALCGSVDISAAIGANERAPIEASLASQSDMVEVVNALSAEERQALLADQKPEKAAISVMKELLQQQNDRQKTESRMRRMQEMIDQRPDKAKDFYDKYQKKVLGELFREAGDTDTPDFETFKTRFLAADAEARHRAAEAEARRQHAGRRDTQRGIERRLSEQAAKQKLGVVGFPSSLEGSAEVPVTETEENGFKPPKPTRGFSVIAEKRASAEALKAQGAKPEDVELAELEAEIEAANRDPLTGLAQRGRMFEALEGGLEHGKPVGVVYIDMAFLKYFDKEGNGQTGNVAIKKAAELLDGIAADLSKEGVEVEAYRVGGDEFAFSVNGGGPDAVERVKALLVERQETSPPIPLQGDAALGSFYKQKLSFNFGSLGPLDLEGMRRLVKENNLPLDAEAGSAQERNELAEYSLRFADKQLEIQKGFNRITLLIEERRKAMKEGNASRYEQLLKYSQKAIFGEPGVQLINELSEQAGEIPAERLLSFVIQELKKKGQAKENYEASIDRVIDERVRELYFEQQINGLKHQLSVMQSELVKTKGENAELKKKVTELEQEVQNVSNLKQRILSS